MEMSNTIQLANPGSSISFYQVTGPKAYLCHGLPEGKQFAARHYALRQAGVKDMNTMVVYIPYPN
jgi:hypothetical protein